MFIIAISFQHISPGIIVTDDSKLAWECFFAHAHEGYSVTIQKDVLTKASWSKADGFRIGPFA